MKSIRRLKADEIECRVAQATENGASLLLYKTARVDATILTETYGGLWQNDFKVIDGKMYGGIGVWNEELNQWIWRWDCGTESNTEAEKGQASDCFKRAGFKFLIGQELYKAPFIWVNVPTKKNSSGKWQVPYEHSKFTVKEIDYAENGDIKYLHITDSKGKTLFKTGVYLNKPKTKPQKDDKDIYLALANINDIKLLKEYYELNKENVNNKEDFHALVVERQRIIKEAA